MASMNSPILLLTSIRYYRERPGWDQEDIKDPPWEEVEKAVRRMENYCFPIVELNPTEHEDCADRFMIVGGAGRWALRTADWEYVDPAGGEEEVRLWESDQGYFCQAKNVLTNIEEVLRITRVFYETGSVENWGERR